MSEYAVGDRVRVACSRAPQGYEEGTVVFISDGLRYSLWVAAGAPRYESVMGYRPDEVQLVSAVISAPRTVTVVI